MKSPATIQPAVPSTRIGPNSCFGSCIWRNESELVSAIVGMKQRQYKSMMVYSAGKPVCREAANSKIAPVRCKQPRIFSVAAYLSATRPTKKGATIAPTPVAPPTIPTCSPVKCNEEESQVLIVTYQEPQTKYSRNIIKPRRDFIGSFKVPPSRAA